MKIHTPKLTMLLPAVLLAVLAFVPRSDEPIAKLVSSLQSWTDNNPQEKVYLHTDRPWYSIGDTIWYKAYVTIGPRHQLSGKSGALYVELVNSADSITKILRLPVMAGMAKGCFALGNELREGNYRIRSYTQWMRNAGPDHFYDHVFIIKNSLRDSIFTKINYEYASRSGKLQATAVLTFTNQFGKPLSNSEVRYNLRKNYQTLLKGSETTDAHGVARIMLTDITAAQLKGAHLATTVEAEDFNLVKKIFSIKSIAMQANVQFFAEGGNFIADMNNRLAFKAVGTDGLGIAVKGELMDNGYKAGTFESTHLGMGIVDFKPLRYHTYIAKATFADGSTKEVALPPVQDHGYLLAVRPHTSADSVTVITGTAPWAHTGYMPPLYMILQAGGEVYYADSLSTGKKPTSINLSINDIPSGIAQVTLFSATGRPLNERIFFVQHNDKLDVELKSDKAIYERRGKVNLRLNAKANDADAAISNFSVAVINEDDVPVDENKETTIFSHLLLSSDIKGYVEQPSYYFNKPNAITKQQLDVLMLTQGYRRFNWPDVLTGVAAPPTYRAEGLASEISGKLIGLWGLKIPFGKVILFNNKTKLQLVNTTDKDGRFSFNNIVMTDGLDFTVAGRRAKNGTRLELLLDKYVAQKQSENPNIGDMQTNFTGVPLDDRALSPEQLKAFKQRQAYNQNNKVQAIAARGRILKEVAINRTRYTRKLNYSLAAIKGQIIESIIFNEFDAGKTPIKALKDRHINGLKINKFANSYQVYIDGQLGSIFINDQSKTGDKVADILGLWDVEDIVKIDIVRPNLVTPPALIIYTRRLYIKDWIDPLDTTKGVRWKPEISAIKPRGFDRVKEFYVPKYDASQQAVYADMRTTVYWNPAVIVTNGSATLSFYNGDKPGNYKVVVEGINADGLLGRQVLRYKVE